MSHTYQSSEAKRKKLKWKLLKYNEWCIFVSFEDE